MEAAGDLGGRIGDYCRAWPGVLELAAAPVTVPGGEAAQNDWRQVEAIWELINEKGIDRHCYVVAIGGRGGFGYGRICGGDGAPWDPAYPDAVDDVETRETVG